MNAEIIKAMNKKETKIDKIHKWWDKNGYKVMRVVLFPLWWGIKAKEKITSYLNSREEWSEERVKEILSYYIPRRAEWDADDKCFYFFDNGYGWSMCSAKNISKEKTVASGMSTVVGMAAIFVLISLMNLNLKDSKKKSATAMTVGLKFLSK